MKYYGNEANIYSYIELQPPEVFCNKKDSLIFRKFHRKTVALEPLLI